MKRQIIITDLTRFKEGNPNVCIAGIDRKTGECIRPMPHLTSAVCRHLRIQPGGILSGDFESSAEQGDPHQEDCHHQNLMFDGPCSSEEFRTVLAGSCFPCIEEGFEVSLPFGEKVIPKHHPVRRSIISLQVSPWSVSIIEDSYKPGRIKLNFTDSSGREYRFFPITDLGFFDFALKHHDDGKLDELNEWIGTQDEVYLRIGLSRIHTSPQGKEGYWMQGNGIYTFPAVPPEIRAYDS